MSQASPCLPLDSTYMPQRDHCRPPCMVGANSLGLVSTVGTAVTNPA